MIIIILIKGEKNSLIITMMIINIPFFFLKLKIVASNNDKK